MILPPQGPITDAVRNLTLDLDSCDAKKRPKCRRNAGATSGCATVLAMGKLGLYVQVPFCQTKCTYCNFYTGVVSAERFTPYIEAVCREIRHHNELYRAARIEWPRSFDWETLRETSYPEHVIDSVYLGGGTPSLLAPALLSAVLHVIADAFSCAWEELTLEADPETVETHKAEEWVAAGINRISFGSQSFVDEELKAAGRMHRSDDIYKAVAILRNAGIANISFDLIAGLPKQTHDSWQYSLTEAMALLPEHVSVYMMEIDEGSRLGLEVLRGGERYSAKELPSEEAMADFYQMAQEQLGAVGYEQYEISNWAKPGFASKHNLKYWCRDPYLGFGAGAHSFSRRQRWANIHDAGSYVAAISAGRNAIENVEAVTNESALEEELFLGLRQLAGINLGRIEREYGVNLEDKIARLASNGMVVRRGDVVKLVPSKLSVSNEVLVELLRS